MRRLLLFILITAASYSAAVAQPFTRQDTLRGSNGRGRDWWDVEHYLLALKINPDSQNIRGTNTITFRIGAVKRDSLQIDLQSGMNIARARLNGNEISFHREGEAYWLVVPHLDITRRSKDSLLRLNSRNELMIDFYGKPRKAIKPPWDGGFIWGKDSLGNRWTAVACQGQGASCWWPCKDYQGDEPNRGVETTISFDSKTAMAISNGRLDLNKPYPAIQDRSHNPIPTYIVKNPINTYNTTFYIGDYAQWSDTFQGEKGVLDLNFYPLKYNEARARKQWQEVKPMLRCFEHWMGPYPFYEDGYKLVEAPYLGMEHQSAVAYGNQYKMGYLGRDLSNTDEGLKFDFITIHESGHEWFGNNITAMDVADNWIHEGITTYTEVLYLEWIGTKESGFRYMQGRFKGIQNEAPVIGPYGVHKEGEDIYEKGAAVIHMVRMIMGNDEKFRQLLRGLNKTFYHKTVTTKEVEEYISTAAGKDLKPFFNLYLRSTTIPIVSMQDKNGGLEISLRNAPGNFSLPVYSSDGIFLLNLSGTTTFIAQTKKGAVLNALKNYLLEF